MNRLFFFSLVVCMSCATPPRSLKSDEPPLPPEDGYATTAPDEPVLIHEVKVRYPEEAYQKRLGGTVRMKVYLDDQGVVSRAEVFKSFGYGMDEAALDAIRQFRFRPAQDKDGKPIPFLFVYRYTFVY